MYPCDWWGLHNHWPLSGDKFFQHKFLQRQLIIWSTSTSHFCLLLTGQQLSFLSYVSWPTDCPGLYPVSIPSADGPQLYHLGSVQYWNSSWLSHHEWTLWHPCFAMQSVRTWHSGTRTCSPYAAGTCWSVPTAYSGSPGEQNNCECHHPMQSKMIELECIHKPRESLEIQLNDI